MFEKLSDLFLTLLVILLLACATFGLSHIIFMPIVLLFNKYKGALPAPRKFLEKDLKIKLLIKNGLLKMTMLIILITTQRLMEVLAVLFCCMYKVRVV